MPRNKRSIAILGLMITAFFLVDQGTRPNVMTQLPGEDSLLVAVYGAAIPQEALDGVIGPEWDDAQGEEMRLGRYQAEILLKHDGEYLYVAMIVKTRRRFAQGFEGYVVFDNGDGRNYSRGDDIISVLAKDGRLLEADYYYKGTYDFRLDTRVGGQNNAYGAGRYDSENRWYIFEFVKKLVSNDAKDVPLNPGDDVTTTYGWASY